MTRFITTSLNSNPWDTDIALDISQDNHLLYVKRDNLSRLKLFEKYKTDSFFIIKNKTLTLIDKEENELFFHPGTGLIKTKMLERGENDLLISALNITPADSVLDCTMGLANDSVVISYFLEKGKLTSLEKSKEIFLITKHGLLNYPRGSKKLKDSFKRIIVKNQDFNDIFECYEKENLIEVFDSIYFDPMFEKPVHESQGIMNLRKYASYDQITPSTIERALRLSRKNVVVKIRNNNFHFVKETIPSKILGGSRSKIRYAVFEK